MTEIAMDAEAPSGESTAPALRDVAEAGRWAAAAKRTHSAELIAHAERALQAAVDAARDLDVPWGEIGSALGIARGNAYQRYRKRPSLEAFQSRPEMTAAYRNPSPLGTNPVRRFDGWARQ